MARDRLKKIELGITELVDKPTPKELENFYNDRYFDSNNFEVNYSDEGAFFIKQLVLLRPLK